MAPYTNDLITTIVLQLANRLATCQLMPFAYSQVASEQSALPFPMPRSDPPTAPTEWQLQCAKLLIKSPSAAAATA